MLLVRKVSGPTTAAIREDVTYHVTAFNEPMPQPRDTARVSWLIKTTDGAALTHLSRHGPVMELAIPESWAGQTAVVMPYMNSPSAAVSVRTRVGAWVPSPAAAHGRRDVQISREGARFYASINGEPRFYLGSRVRYGARRGLMNSGNPPGSRYWPENYEDAYGDWAWYLFPTIRCESNGHFTCLNTYDRAAFTFGHIQLAAHTPDDNFVAFFRELLAHPTALEYFPDLALSEGRIHLKTTEGLSPLETAATTAPLMDYFNATPSEVDDREADRTARIVDWCLRYPAMSDMQVAFAVRQQQRKLVAHARRLPLDGVVDKLCLVVLDILHQGRATYRTIAAALAAGDPFDALLSIRASEYSERIATLRAGIKDLEVRGKVGVKVYDREEGDFVVPSGA